MKWSAEANPRKRRFAWLPVSVRVGLVYESVWLEYYWARFCGDCFEISFTKEKPND